MQRMTWEQICKDDELRGRWIAMDECSFDEATGRANSPIYGCVTTGEAWQFLRLNGQAAMLHHVRIYLDNIRGILGALLAIYQDATNAEANHRLSA